VPTTSSDADAPVMTFEDFQSLDESVVTPWKVYKTNFKDCVKIELFDTEHSIAKFTLEVNSRLEFIIFVYNWPVPDSPTIYTSRSR
jgi:hypothetical protein